MTSESYVCRGSGEVGAAKQDVVGWCPVCQKIQRARVGTGRLHTHWTPYAAHARRVVTPERTATQQKIDRWRRGGQ